jgi:hypothetical protein
LPVFRFEIAREMKALLNKAKIKSKREELRDINKELHAAKERVERRKHKKRKKRVQQEIFRLERELRAAKEQRTEGEPVTGALPDFAVIGVTKGGTTFLYHLLTQHPHVEPAAAKELHFFDTHFDEGIEWYRGCFPTPRWKNGRRTITGEGTPYLTHRLAPERMAQVVPQARLIALLRNPVDRAYSHYQQVVRKGRETQTFEEAIARREYFLSGGIYVDQLLRWSEFFSDEQMLVLKSEDFFERPVDTLKVVLDFLDLPDWKPEASEVIPKKRNKGNYERGMDPATRRWLEDYFEPHNQRLYEYLGVDFGW